MKIASVGGRCELCCGIGNEVHHEVRPIPENLSNPRRSINQDNLMLLCNEYHNKMHERVEGKIKY
jgi:5-methylcytosine-specific restriction endonuclease McrA